MKRMRTDGIRWLAFAMSVAAYAGGVIFGDVMFLSMVKSAFPDGIIANLAWAGGLVVAASALAIPLALHALFEAGSPQYVFGVIFWLADILVLGLNSMLAYQMSVTGNVSAMDDLLKAWYGMAPATPMLAVIGWGIIWMLGPVKLNSEDEPGTVTGTVTGISEGGVLRLPVTRMTTSPGHNGNKPAEPVTADPTSPPEGS